MAMKKVKFRMSIEKLSFEYEGDQETGQNIQQSIQRTLGSLVETQNRLVAPDLNTLEVEAVQVPDNGSAKTRTSRPRRPKGTSARSLILGLREQGFFDQNRAIGDIQTELSKNAHNFKQNHISAALTSLIQKRYLKRDKNDKGNYEYQRGEFNGEPGDHEDAE